MDPHPPPPLHPSDTSFPIIAVAVIGIIATAFLLVSYYIFVIKCCLNWHRIDILRRFSLSRGRAHEEALMAAHSPSGMEPRGLEESVIRSIPVFKYTKTEQQQQPEKQGKSEPAESCSAECAVCLNEFVEEERLRRIPNCGHLFHIDCIDVWLQSNANCPLCRTSISSSSAAGVRLSMFAMGQGFGSSTPQDPSPTPYPERMDIGGDEDYVVIELGNYVTNSRQSSTDRTLRGAQERLMNSGELPRKFESRLDAAVEEKKKGRKVGKVMRSKGDECIDLTRGREERLGIQPIRRSFSMDSSADGQLLLKIQEMVQQQQSSSGQNGEVGIAVEGCSSSSSRSRRNFFSFGHSRVSKNAVLAE